MERESSKHTHTHHTTHTPCTLHTHTHHAHTNTHRAHGAYTHTTLTISHTTPQHTSHNTTQHTRTHTTSTPPSPAHMNTFSNSFCVMRVIRHEVRALWLPGQVRLLRTERELTERVDILRESRKGSCEERERRELEDK